MDMVVALFATREDGRADPLNLDGLHLQIYSK